MVLLYLEKGRKKEKRKGEKRRNVRIGRLEKADTDT